MRSVATAIQTALEALAAPEIVVLIDINTAGERYARYRKDVTWKGNTYTAASIDGEDFGENMKFEAVRSSVKIASLDGSRQATFQADTYRGDTCTVSLIRETDINSSTDAFWQTTYTIDYDGVDHNTLHLALGSDDVVRGTYVPRLTTREVGCQREFKRGGCPYRGHVDPKTGKVERHTTCDRGLFTENGCAVKFPTVTDPVTGDTVRQPLPYLAFPGSLSWGITGGRG